MVRYELRFYFPLFSSQFPQNILLRKFEVNAVSFTYEETNKESQLLDPTS